MKATAKDLRFRSKELIDSVARGEEVVITFRGTPCAKLIPYQQESRDKGKNELFGIWQDKESTDNVDDYVRDLRKGRF